LDPGGLEQGQPCRADARRAIRHSAVARRRHRKQAAMIANRLRVSRQLAEPRSRSALRALRECLPEPGVRLRQMVERVQEYLPIRWEKRPGSNSDGRWGQALSRAPLGCKEPHGGPLRIEFAGAVYHVSSGAERGARLNQFRGSSPSCLVPPTSAFLCFPRPDPPAQLPALISHGCGLPSPGPPRENHECAGPWRSGGDTPDGRSPLPHPHPA